MPDFLRAFLASDAFVIVPVLALALCGLALWRVWRSPQSWHIDGESKDLHFHAWPQLGIFVCFGAMFLTVGYLVLL